MNYFENAIMSEEPKVMTKENAKLILENMDAILNELDNTLSSIETALFSPKPSNKDGREPLDECILGTLNRQRNHAEEILKIAMHIREGLW